MKLSPWLRVALPIVSALLLWGCSAESKRERALERADAHFKAKAYEKARIEYQNVLQGAPENIEANERMALIWLERGAPLRAAAFLSKLKTVAPGNVAMRLKLAEILLSMGNASEARREALSILQRSPGFANALVVLVEAIRNPDDVKAAEQILRDFPEKSAVSYQIASAKLMAQRGDVEGARTTLQRAVIRDSKAVDARLALAALLAGQNQRPEALAEFRLAADASPVNAPARLKYAAYLSLTGAVKEAVSYLSEMSRQAPDYLPALRALAQIAMGEKKFEEAQARLQALFALEPFDYEGRVLRARLWLMQGEPRKAIEDLEAFGREFPGLGVEKHQLALAYLQANDLPSAMKALQEVVGRNPDNLDAAVLLAQLNLRRGAPQPAAQAMAELLTQRPNVIPAYPILIDAMRAIGRLDQAGGVIANALKASPQNAQLYYYFGVVLNQLQKPAEARQSLEKTLELSPGHIAAISELVTLDLRESKLPSALQRARAVTAAAPKSALGYFLEARVHAAERKWDEAEAVLLRALEIESNQQEIYGLLGEVIMARKDDPATPTRLESLLAKRPGDEFVAIIAAQFHGQRNDFPKAREVYEKLLAAKPNAAVVLNNLAALYDEKLNQSDRAVETARQARKLEPSSPVIADTLGWILFRRKEYPEAATLLEEAVKGLAQNPEVQYHVGMVRQALGNKEGAVAALRLAAGATGDFMGKDEARRLLALLEQGR